MGGPLAGIRVLELCDELAGANCTRQFAAWGADVVTVEPPDGSRLRRLRPLLAGSDGIERSLVWEYVAAGKGSRVLDPAAPDFAERLRAALSGGDVFVTDWKPSRLAAVGIAHEALQDAFPRLVQVSSRPFGLSGPYADYEGTDIVVQALAGFMAANGLPDREPLKTPANIIPYACGVSAFVAALAALWERDRSGAGQLVESAWTETVATFVYHLRTEYTGQPAVRHGSAVAGAWRMLRCGDGRSLSTGPAISWEHFLIALGIDEAEVPDRLRDPAGRTADAVAAFLEERLADRCAREVFQAVSAVGGNCGVTNTLHDLLSDPHLAARGFFRDLDGPVLGRLTMPGPPALLSESPMAVLSPAPALGDAGAAPTVHRPADRGPRSTVPPLAGVRIVDLTGAWIGPYATLLLSMLGADVIKVESHARPDVWRGWRALSRPYDVRPRNPDAHPGNLNPNFNSVNMNKRDITLDLNTAQGKALFLGLVKRADLVMENYTPRVMENFGLGYEALQKVKPDLVMVSFSGFGRSGPYRDYRANGATTEATSGWDMLLGYPGGPPMMMGGMPADAITGLQMAATALIALIHRERTGTGQQVDGSMFEAGVGYIGEEILLASAVGETAERRGNRDRNMAPHGLFPCAGEDAWVAVAVRDDEEFRRLVAVVGPEGGLDDPRFATPDRRLAHLDELEARLSAWTRPQTSWEVMDRLQAAGVPAGVFQSTDGVLADPHFAARGWFRPLDHPDMGPHKHNGPPWRFTRTPAVVTAPSPRLGEHSVQVLRGELGLSDAEVEALIAAGVTTDVIADRDDAAVPATE